LRVTKPDGVVIMNAPDYTSLHEGHYNVLWLPYVLAGSKRLAKWYVRTIVGRPDYYLDDLNFTTPRRLRRLVQATPGASDVRTYHFLCFPLSYISATHYYLSLGLTSRHRVLAWIGKVPWIRASVRWSTGFVSRLLAGLALAPMFSIVYRKTSPPARRG
jgi:hypothetical protein